MALSGFVGQISVKFTLIFHLEICSLGCHLISIFDVPLQPEINTGNFYG